MCLWMSVLISQLFLYDQEQRYNGSFSLDLNRMPDQYPQRVMQLNRQQNLFMLLVTKNNIFDLAMSHLSAGTNTPMLSHFAK